MVSARPNSGVTLIEKCEEYIPAKGKFSNGGKLKPEPKTKPSFSNAFAVYIYIGDSNDN